MKILIIRLSSIGDCVLASPVLEALRDRYPDAHISWAVQAKSAPVIRGLPGFGPRPGSGGVLLWNDRGNHWHELSRTLLKAARTRYDVTLDLQGLDKSALFNVATGADRRISGQQSRRLARWTATEQAAEHQVEHARLFGLRRARQLDIAADYADRYFPRVPLTDNHRAQALRMLAELGIEPDHPLVGLNLGAAHAFKRWPAARFAQLTAAILKDDSRTRVVVFGAPSDSELLAAYEAHLNEHLPSRGNDNWKSRVVSGVGRFNLMQLAAASERCNAFVTADTGPMHIAAAAGAPVVALFGPTNSRRTAPVQRPGAKPVRLLDARDFADAWPAPMEAITVGMVLEEVRNLLPYSQRSPATFTSPAAAPARNVSAPALPVRA